MNLQGVIFDLDGTLANTLPVCFAAFRRAYYEFTGKTYTDQEVEATFGPSEEGAIQRAVPEAHWDACLQVFLEEYDRVHGELCRAPFPGMVEVLEWLQAQGIRRAIVTGKGAHSAKISLRHTGLAPYFSEIETGSVQGVIKPQAIQKIVAGWGIPSETVAYVGDALADVHSARTAGVVPLAAAWTPTADYTGLEKLVPYATFRTVESFASWLAESR